MKKRVSSLSNNSKYLVYRQIYECTTLEMLRVRDNSRAC
ncbi:hypothetical protein GQ600_18297 [Phytophthora cactorum]|nr:hypothetical protein GQ600_18297 [Phytophthora cactorum]